MSFTVRHDVLTVVGHGIENLSGWMVHAGQ
jgi:hypothetical protein